MYLARKYGIVRQTEPYDKTGDVTKGVGVAKFDFIKPFRNQLFSRVRVLYHQFSKTNHSESILIKSKKDGKDQETIQSSTTPDPGYHKGK